MTTRLHIRLLGNFGIARDEGPVLALPSERVRSLVARLVLHAGEPQSRRQLAFLFWPDTTDAQAATNLRNLLHKLRLALPD